MRRMRASWSSWIWEIPPTSLEGGRGVGDVVPELLDGRGGRGIAGGGEGKEATEDDLRTPWPFCWVCELDRWGVSVESLGRMLSYLAWMIVSLR